MQRETLSLPEQAVMRHTFKATMLRAADIIDRITDADVDDARYKLHQEGVSLERLAKVDRAMLAAAHLRSCSLKGKEAQVSTADLKVKL